LKEFSVFNNRNSLLHFKYAWTNFNHLQWKNVSFWKKVFRAIKRGAKL